MTSHVTLPPLGDKGYVYSTFLKQYNPLRDSQRANQKAKEQQQPPVITYEDFDDLSLFVSPSSSSMRSLSLNTTDSSSTLSGLQGELENAEELEELVDGDTQQVCGAAQVFLFYWFNHYSNVRIFYSLKINK